jgi:hypothetical protein
MDRGYEQVTAAVDTRDVRGVAGLDDVLGAADAALR